MRPIILDSEAVSRLARAHQGAATGAVHHWIRAAADVGARIIVPAAVLSEQYRGTGHDQFVNACLSRYPGIEIVDTTRALARMIGNLLSRAKVGSEHHVDASVVASAIMAGTGVILTSDPSDIGMLSGGNPSIQIIQI